MPTAVHLLLLPPPPPLRRRHVITHSSSSTTDCPVPFDQQPVNEYKSLSSSFPFSLAPRPDLETRMFLSGAAFAGAVGFPVAWVGSQTDLERAVVGAVSSGLIFVTVAVVRMYLGWAYVGNRLLSATVEYEETGWYDGQIWVKNAEVLARDRLLGTFSVKPVLSRLKNTLVVLAASLLVCAITLINLEGNQKNLHDISSEPGGRAVPGVYNDESARSFEPDAFCGEPELQ